MQQVRLRYVGAASGIKMTGVEPLASTINAYFGDQPEGVREGVTTFAAIRYMSLYPGIDLRYEGSEGRLKSTFVLAPAANPAQIRWQYEGVNHLLIDPGTGDLQIPITVQLTPEQQAQFQFPISTTTITLTERAPSAWQETANGRVSIPVSRLVGFVVRLSANLSSIETRTYFGSSASTFVSDLALDSQNRPIVVGMTSLADIAVPYPTTSSFQTTHGGSWDAVITRFSADGSTLSYSTLMGNSSVEYAYSVAIGRDAADADHIYMTGLTRPPIITPLPRSIFTPSVMDARAWQKDWAGVTDAYVVRLNTGLSGTNALVYGSLIGSNREDYGYGIAARQGVAYIVGQTFGTGTTDTPIPLSNAQPGYTAPRGGGDIFMVALDTTATTPIMPTSGFFGGTLYDNGRGIAVDSAGAITLGGTVTVTDGTTQAYVVQVDPSATPLTFSVTDANGQPVAGLIKNADGWPVLNASGSGAIANPVRVVATIVNQTASTLTNSTFKFEVIGNNPGVNTGRFYPTSIAAGCQTAASTLYNAQNAYSFKYQRNECLRTFAPSTQWQYEFFYWILNHHKQRQFNSVVPGRIQQEHH